jgi:hypothetical protein
MLKSKKGNERLNLILQTICGIGTRVSVLQFITVEAIKSGEAVVLLKGKTWSLFLVKELKKAAPLCCGTENSIRRYFCQPHGQADKPHRYLT